MWSDGTLWNYANWISGNPSNSNGGWGRGEDCSMMWHSTSGGWNDMFCDNYATGGYACSYDLNGKILL